ncbi:Pseudouridine kinase [Durusdinium trenchii]|uniref:Pseudouridine kinase n=1 Tax=Durusdinium trenchii TaxID=1381693 RepID=A0ABP0RB85_9DINO
MDHWDHRGVCEFCAMVSGALMVCGGAVVDCIVRPFDSEQRGASRTSMPGEARISQGGVGRNMAEVSLRLGCPVRLLSAVGADEPGRQLLNHCQQLGIIVEDVAVLQGARTATYTALLDGSGELVGAVADMAILDNIPPEVLVQRCSSLEDVKLVLCEANLNAQALKAALETSRGKQTVEVWFDPVSVAKASRGVAGVAKSPWQLAAPNWDELLAMLGKSQRPLQWQNDELPADLVEAAAEALVPGFGFAEKLLLSLGSKGCVLARQLPDAPDAQTSNAIVRKVEIDVAGLVEQCSAHPNLVVQLEERRQNGCSLLWYRLLRPLDHVQDVTGAGDALLAGTASAFVAGWDLQDAIFVGLVAAHLTLFVAGSICDQLRPEILQRLQQQLHIQSRL